MLGNMFKSKGSNYPSYGRSKDTFSIGVSNSPERLYYCYLHSMDTLTVCLVTAHSKEEALNKVAFSHVPIMLERLIGNPEELETFNKILDSDFMGASDKVEIFKVVGELVLENNYTTVVFKDYSEYATEVYRGMPAELYATIKQLKCFGKLLRTDISSYLNTEALKKEYQKVFLECFKGDKKSLGDFITAYIKACNTINFNLKVANFKSRYNRSNRNSSGKHKPSRYDIYYDFAGYRHRRYKSDYEMEREERELRAEAERSEKEAEIQRRINEYNNIGYPRNEYDEEEDWY